MKTLKNIYQWIASDGLLHILMSMVVVLCLQPLVGTILAVCVAVLLGAGKEIYDGAIQKDNNGEQILHDVVCDVVGIILAIIVVSVWNIV